MGLKFETINCEDGDNAELIKGFDIEGYPTLVYVNGNEKSYYDGERTTAAIEKWVATK